MAELNIFEQATKQKLRFASVRGSLSVEDLWDLSLTSGQINLNDLAVGVNRSLKESEGEESFVPTTKTGDADVARLRLQLDVLKRIIAVKVEERDVREAARDKSAKKRVLQEALVEAQNTALKSKTPEEIQAMIDAL